MVHEALQAAEQLAAQGVEAAVIDPVTVKPLDEELIRRYAAACGVLVTAENHNRIGGLYSAVCDCLAANRPVPVGCVAVEDAFGEVGPADELAERFGLTAGHIAAEVEKTVARK